MSTNNKNTNNNISSTSTSNTSSTSSMSESIRIVPRGDIALVEWDLAGEKVNKLSSVVMSRLKDVLEEIKKSSFKAVVMISRKQKIFIAGADIDEIRSIKTQEKFIEVVQTGQSIINMIEDLPIPVIAAINGACLGGGCELAMACDWRIVGDDTSTRIGLPETKLGIIPGFGGCIRLPRIIGLQAALDIILAGKAVDGKKALKLGWADQCVPSLILEDKAFEFARELIKTEKCKKRKKCFKSKGIMSKLLETIAGRALVFSMAKKTIMKTTHGHYPAPLKALEVIKKTYCHGSCSCRRDSSLDAEARGFSEVAGTDISMYLIDLFYMMEGVKKIKGVSNNQIKARPVSNVGVLGAGTMGGGIAQVASDKGIFVRLKDINKDAIALGLASAAKIWSKDVSRRKISKYDFNQKINRVNGGLDYSGFENMNVVIEAIVEDMGVKKKVIADCAQHVNANCILASNTSSLSITEMAQAAPNPENFVGMHFFNPVNKMPLVEVIRGAKTSDEATATIFELAKRMGKVPVVVKDGPGFLVNRLLLPYLAEAVFLLNDGMSVEKLDKIYVKEFGMPMGPLHLMDEIGIDVCVKVLKIFKKSLGERIEVSPLMDKLESTGRLGKKNRKGFYLWDEQGKKQGVDPNIYTDLGLKIPTDTLSNKECLQRGVFMMINEAAIALIDEKIVETAKEVDLAMILGTGFPPFRGGLLKYADSVGSGTIVKELENYSSVYGKRFKPTQPLLNMAKASRKFYT